MAGVDAEFTGKLGKFYVRGLRKYRQILVQPRRSCIHGRVSRWKLVQWLAFSPLNR